MTINKLYVYTGENGVLITPRKNGDDYVNTQYRIVAEDGYHLVHPSIEDDTISCIDVDSVEGWSEAENDEQLDEQGE